MLREAVKFIMQVSFGIKFLEPLILCSSKLHLYFAGKIVGQIYKSDEGTVRKVTNGISSSFLV